MTPSNDLSGRAPETKRVLVTGATGQQGGALALRLIERGHKVRALTRKPDGPAALELKKIGAEVVLGNFDDRASVERAAKGIDVAFVVATPFEKGPVAETQGAKNALDGARAAGVPYLVYSSVGDADRKTGIPHFDSKAEVEKHLQGLGVDYSIVAPVFFMENFLSPWLAAGFAKGTIAMGVLPDKKLQMISVQEIADFTTLAIEQRSAFRGKRVNIASDELVPHEFTSQIAKASGAKVGYYAIPIDQVRQQNEDFARMYDWFNRVGYSADIPKLKRDYPQVHWRTFHDWATKQDWARVLPRP